MDGADHALSAFGIAWRLGATLFFVALNGFFVATEFSLVKVRRSRMERRAAEGHRAARVATHVLDHLDRYLSACQLGITLASLALGALGEPAVARLLVAAGHALGVPLADSPALHATAFGIAFALITTLHMTIGEQAPKVWALRRAEATALGAVRPLHAFALVFGPFISVVNGLSNALLRAVGLPPGAPHEPALTSEEIRSVLFMSARSGHISEREYELAENVFRIIDLQVRHIMVPRVDVDFLSVEAPPSENLDKLRASAHSRHPLGDPDLDRVIGLVHTKDVLGALLAGAEPDLRALARPAVFVADIQPLSQLIVQLQNQRSHCAVVVDEHGTAVGLAFLEDALEEIVGPLADEFDEHVAEIQEVAPGVFDVRASMALPDALDELGIELADAPQDTIGGHVVALLGRLPRRGDELDLGGYRVRVEEVLRRRVMRLRFTRLEAAPAEG
jgi:magnesium and cobalt exporter, CNNM family